MVDLYPRLLFFFSSFSYLFSSLSQIMGGDIELATADGSFRHRVHSSLLWLRLPRLLDSARVTEREDSRAPPIAAAAVHRFWHDLDQRLLQSALSPLQVSDPVTPSDGVVLVRRPDPWDDTVFLPPYVEKSGVEAIVAWIYGVDVWSLVTDSTAAQLAALASEFGLLDLQVRHVMLLFPPLHFPFLSLFLVALTDCLFLSLLPFFLPCGSVFLFLFLPFSLLFILFSSFFCSLSSSIFFLLSY